MKLKSLPKELFVEVLDYLADYEHLSGLDQVLDDSYTVLDVRSAIREVSLQLRKEIEQEKTAKSLPNYQKDDLISQQAKRILSVLSPTDERRLLEKFGFLDE